ncbi:uncharacterized protein LOC131425979 [Malaya genurostris]|uniref:uncharacterized protein LOC131425979 n=1 Tax=Malaya genurostris TaxID=325434 RepID=UPI0026F39BB2|nr:uncharacterized protein LOC131425979 [Malaya genurostris]
MEPVMNNEAEENCAADASDSNETQTMTEQNRSSGGNLDENRNSVEFTTMSQDLRSRLLSTDSNECETSTQRCSEFTLSQARKFRSPAGNEFIKRKTSTCKKISQLNFSARFTLETLEIKLHSEGRLMLVDDDLLARVTIERPELLDGTNDFQQAKQVLLEQIRIEEVVLDGLLLERNQLRTDFVNILKDVGSKTAIDRRFAMDCISLKTIFGDDVSCELSDYQCVCEKIMKSRSFSVQLTNTVTKLYDVECSLKRRNELLPCIPSEENFPILLETLKQILSNASDVHRKCLLEQVPGYLSSDLENVSPERIMLISSRDIGILADVENILDGVDFQKPLKNLANRFTANVNGFDISEFSVEQSLINPAFVLLCKSLKDLLQKIVKNSDMKCSDLIQIDTNTFWNPTPEITWKIKGNSGKCLEREYLFIFKLLNHFEPGSNVDCKSFEYKSKLFVGSENCNLAIDPSQNMQESFIWCCLLDDALSSIATRNQLTAYEKILQEYVSLVRKVNQDELEFVRVMSHALVDFIACTVELVENEEEYNLEVDRKILQKHLHLLISEMSFGSSNTNRFHEMVEVFVLFWNYRKNIIAKFSSKIDLPEMNELAPKLLDVVQLVLEKSVEFELVLEFFNTYNAFVLQLDALSFDWIVKTISGVEMQNMIPYKLIEPLNQERFPDTFRVLNPLKFVQMMKMFHSEVEIPEPQIILIMKSCLSLTMQQLNRKQWSSGLDLSASDQITTTITLISTLTKRLMNSKDFCYSHDSFDHFLAANVELLNSKINECKSTSDFTWIGIEEDLILAFNGFDKFNSFHDKQSIRTVFHQYSEQFQQYVSLKGESRVVEIAEKLKATKIRHFSSWDAQFKQVELPKILAGIAALWFTSTPKTVEFPKLAEVHGLHGFQILCILRMLGVDDPGTGVSKHFSEIPPGEGKTLIIRLIAILLALTGHSVRVHCGCYLDQIEKNRADLNRVFGILDVGECISYSTVWDFGYFGSVLLNGTRVLSSGFAKNSPERIMTGSLDNSVLLIDDINVFFNRIDFWTTVHYFPHLFIILPGLDKIQTKIWNLTIESTEQNAIKNAIYEYIKSSEFPEKDRWKTFLSLPGEFKWISDDNKEMSFTNRKLFDTHLADMIRDAGRVYKNHNSIWSNYANDKSQERKYSYYKTFHYLANEKSQTSLKTGDKLNYGFLMMKSPKSKFITALSDFPLVFGVFGEKFHEDQINYLEQFCDIKEWTKMPSVFGCSKLQFDKKASFYKAIDESSYLDKIFNSARKVIDSHRSVIIVCFSKVQMKNFENNYGKHFTRINFMYEDTPNEEKHWIIDEIGGAGIVTVVFWTMIAGLDYKSSEIVEGNGGVHVIQAFSDFDTIRENQIKGLTARRGNQGSYEIITWNYTDRRYDEFNKSKEKWIQENLKPLPSEHSKLTERKEVFRTFVNKFKF